MQRRLTNRLADAHCRSAGPGKLFDGGGLMLVTRRSGSQSWVLRYRFQNRRPEIGLGGYPAVSLASARKKRDEAHQLLAERPPRDPLQVWREIEEQAKAGSVTFGDAVDRYLEMRGPQWKNEKHRQQWANTLATYASPMTGLPISEVDTDVVLRCLEPIWREKHETASRVRGRMEKVLDYAAVQGWRAADQKNPAVWKGNLEHVLTAQPPSPKHHAAMPLDDVPAFYRRLREKESTGARALCLVILTAARSGEVRWMRWEEISKDDNVWTVPASRMKMEREHQVPLSGAAVRLLKSLPGQNRSGLVFRGQKNGQPLSDNTMTRVLRREDSTATVHGFRSVFRDWAGDRTDYPRELAEHALSHAVGDKAEQAYRRGTALERRREMMKAWARFLKGG